MTQAESIADLAARALKVKERFLAMYHKAHAGHVGTSLSCAEILCFLKFYCMRAGDELILSKGHAAAALYALLAEANEIPDALLDTFYQDGTLLPAHPPAHGIAAIPFATGSLGHGLGLACGLAYGAQLKKNNQNIFCLTSDGELNEGSTWEAALFAAKCQLSNLYWYIDRNGLQGFGRTEEVLPLEPLEEKLRAFGWQVSSATGHSFGSLIGNHLDNKLVTGKAKPRVVICDTVKGNGWAKRENTVDCHYLPMTDEDYAATLAKVRQMAIAQSESK